MAVLRWAILCDRTIVEAETKNLSIINVLDEIRLQQAPPEESAKGKRPLLIPHHFTVVQLWNRSDDSKPEKFIVRSQFVSPDEEVYGAAEQNVDLTEHLSSRVIARVPGFPWRGTGRYKVAIQLKTREKWRTVERLHFTLIVATPAMPVLPPH